MTPTDAIKALLCLLMSVGIIGLFVAIGAPEVPQAVFVAVKGGG
jgi:hypothetical protein